MAEVRKFDDEVTEIEDIAKNPASYMTAVTAARYFARALDALLVEYEPDANSSDAYSLYYDLIRKYLLEKASDIEGFNDDDDFVG